MFLSRLYLFLVISNLTVEKLEEILEEKLLKVIQPLSKQIEDAMQSVGSITSRCSEMSPRSSPEGTPGLVNETLLISTNQELACPDRADRSGSIN